MREDKKMPSTPLIILGMTGALMLTAVCVTPPIKTPAAMAVGVTNIDERALPEFLAIHCTHDILTPGDDKGEIVDTRSGGPVTGPILSRGLMHAEGEREGETQLTRQLPRDSHSGEPAPRLRTPSVGSSLPPYRSR